MNKTGLFYTEKFVSYQKSVPLILDAVKADKIFELQDRILLKPNLVNASAFPVTTPPALCAIVIEYIKNCSGADIIIAEGCGDALLDTMSVFDQLGYTKLSSDYGVQLIDLNIEELVEKTMPENAIYRSMFLPKIIFETFFFSLPVLKAHSLAGMTGTLKNMMGVLPPQFYSGSGSWKKAMFHDRIDESIRDLNRYRTPDLTLMDASVGLCEYHLGGRECSPPANQLIISDNPFKMDQYAAALLGLDPEAIPYINYV